VLVGGTLVAVDGDALVDNVATAVEFLAQALHHQLLEVATEHFEPVPVGQDHHVPFALAMACHIPGGGHQGCRIAAQVGHPCDAIHLGRSCQEAADVCPNQGAGQQAYRTGDARAPSHPIEHVEAPQPLPGNGQFVELAIQHCHGYGLSSPLATAGLKSCLGLLHADVGLGSATRLTNHHYQGGT